MYRKNNHYEFYLGNKKNCTMFENKSSNTYFKSINIKRVNSNDNTAVFNKKEEVDIYNYIFEDEIKQLLES